MKTLSETSAEVDRRARRLACELRLADDDLESYQFCIRAVLREHPVLAHEYTGRGTRGDLNSEIRTTLRELAAVLAQLSGRSAADELYDLLAGRFRELAGAYFGEVA